MINREIGQRIKQRRKSLNISAFVLKVEGQNVQGKNKRDCKYKGRLI